MIDIKFQFRAVPDHRGTYTLQRYEPPDYSSGPLALGGWVNIRRLVSLDEAKEMAQNLRRETVEL